MSQPIRFSHLKAFGRAPIFAKHAMAIDDLEATYAMERGSAVHALIFGTAPVIHYPGKRDERVKAWCDFRDANEGALILTEKENVKALAMAASVRENARAMELLAGPGVITEKTILTSINGRAVRGTPDAIGPEGIVDLKTTTKAGEVDFYYHCKRWSYHAQLAWYDRLSKSDRGRFIVAVEDKPPYVCQVYRLGDDLNDEGNRLQALWFEGLVNCEKSGAWPGYGPPEMVLEKPFEDNGLTWGDEEDEAAA